MMKSYIFPIFSPLVCIFIYIAFCICQAEAAREDAPITKLGIFKIHKDAITLSGFSSGGTMAQHLQFSYSSLFSGIGVLNHAFYRCSPGDGNIDNYVEQCTVYNNPHVQSLYSSKNSIQDIKDYFVQGLIENPTNLKNKKLYVYAGTKDMLFSTEMSLRILDVYEPYIDNLEVIKVRVRPTNHNLVTSHFGGPCEGMQSFGNYSIANCGMSAPFDALSFLLGSNVVQLAPPNFGEKISLEPLQSFNQTEFVNKIDEPHYMDSIGYFYIPTACTDADSPCYLHIYFHGCGAGREWYGQNHIRHSGFLEIAEQNRIIMIFPQTISSEGNPAGCWDSFGLTGKYYATQRGAQVIAVRNMLGKILGENFNV